MKKINICPICVAISSLWLMMSAGVAWGYLGLPIYIVPISLLMGGTIVGIAYVGEKKCRWASNNQLLWKTLVIAGGMPIAYQLVNNLDKSAVVMEFILLVVIAYFFFIKRSYNYDIGSSEKLTDKNGLREIEEKMKQCC